MVPVALLGLLLSPAFFWSGALSTSSLEERVDGWSIVWTSALDRPLGAGIGTTGAAAERLAEGGSEAPETFGLPVEDRPYHPDNYYVKRLLELGLPGVWLTLAFLRHVTGWMGRIQAGADPTDVAFVDGAMAGLLGAMVAALAANYWEIFPLDLFFWIAVGAVASVGPRPPAADSPPRAILPDRPVGAPA